MSQEKETFTSEELAAWHKVNRIKAEINTEIGNESVEKEIDPAEKKRLSDENLKVIDRIVDPFIPTVNTNRSTSYWDNI